MPAWQQLMPSVPATIQSWRSNGAVPVVPPDTLMPQVLVELTGKRWVDRRQPVSQC